MDKIDETSEEKKFSVEDADYKLRLLKRLDEEGDKDPDDIDIEKVDKVLNLLDTLSSQERPVKDDKEQFARMMRDKYGLPLVEKKKRPLKVRVMRAAAAAAIFFAAFMTVNFATAKAFDFSIIEWVKRTVSGFYFEYKNEDLEKDSAKPIEKSTDGKIDNVDEVEVEELKSVDEIKERMGDVYIVDKLDDKFEIEYIYYNPLGSLIEMNYIDQKDYIGVSIIKADGEEGGMAISTADNNVIEENKQIKNFTVTICRSFDKKQTSGIFVYREYLYEIDTSLGIDKLYEIIANMKKL